MLANIYIRTWLSGKQLLGCARVDTEQGLSTELMLVCHFFIQPQFVHSFPSHFVIIHVVERTVGCHCVLILDC